VYLSSAVKALIEAVPVLGSTLTKILGERRARNIFARFTELISEFGKELERLGEAKIDKAALQSEEFQSLFAMAIRELEFTEEQEKIRAFKNILAHAVYVDSSKNSDHKHILRVVRDLQTEHIYVLRVIHAHTDIGGTLSILDFQKLFADWPVNRVHRVCNDLARYWLLNAVPAMDGVYQYKFTSFASELLQFISEIKP
jgi:hypothetical protein